MNNGSRGLSPELCFRQEGEDNEKTNSPDSRHSPCSRPGRRSLRSPGGRHPQQHEFQHHHPASQAGPLLRRPGRWQGGQLAGVRSGEPPRRKKAAPHHLLPRRRRQRRAAVLRKLLVVRLRGGGSHRRLPQRRGADPGLAQRGQAAPARRPAQHAGRVQLLSRRTGQRIEPPHPVHQGPYRGDEAEVRHRRGPGLHAGHVHGGHHDHDVLQGLRGPAGRRRLYRRSLPGGGPLQRRRQPQGLQMPGAHVPVPGRAGQHRRRPASRPGGHHPAGCKRREPGVLAAGQ